MKILIDFFPILLFFAAFKMYGIYVATTVAIVATVLQIAYLRFKNGKVEPMQWVSLAVIVLFGGATLIAHNEEFIKWKPTVLYWIMGGTLAIGQILGLLERSAAASLRLGADGRPSADFVHFYSEAARLAYADRAQYVADPAFTDPPAGRWLSLLDPAYLAERARAAVDGLAQVLERRGNQGLVVLPMRLAQLLAHGQGAGIAARRQLAQLGLLLCRELFPIPKAQDGLRLVAQHLGDRLGAHPLRLAAGAHAALGQHGRLGGGLQGEQPALAVGLKGDFVLQARPWLQRLDGWVVCLPAPGGKGRGRPIAAIKVA